MTLDKLSNEDQLEIEYAINENIAEQTSTMNERNYKDINIINTSSTGEINENESNPSITLKNVRLKNLNKIIIGHLNINSIRHKINLLKPGLKIISIYLLYRKPKLIIPFQKINSV